jgi:hypothetical protein
MTLDLRARLSVNVQSVSGAIEELLRKRPELRLDGERPSVEALAARIAQFWLADETVLYVGLAGTSLGTRVNQYYKTPLGARRPHAGGYFLKVLANLNDLKVHFAACDDPDQAEDSMLATFCKRGFRAHSTDSSRLRASVSFCEPRMAQGHQKESRHHWR